MISTSGSNVSTGHYDIFIIGGGINGAGIAREASAEGYSVCLCDAGDFGGGTSSASTKLIHGGLRYLEHFEFRLVREALKEREILWEMAPHIIKPMRFVLPHHKGLRPRWLLRLGLFLYDNLGGRKHLPATKTLNLRSDVAGVPLKDNFIHAFEYSDCWVEDSRLVILNLQDAETLGASIRPRTPVKCANWVEDRWQIQLGDGGDTHHEEVTANCIVNATGPWVDRVLQDVFGETDAKNVRLVRGSHIVVKKKFEHDRSYIFQNSDDRIIFAIPYEGDYTLIGTTDADHTDIETRPKISGSELEYLCSMASEYFDEPVVKDNIVWTYSGIRPLYDDGSSEAQEATRDYVIEVEKTFGKDCLINVFGGKLTTFRKLAFNVLELIEGIGIGKSSHPDVLTHYPGGDFSINGFEDLVMEFQNQFPFVQSKLTRRLCRLYGTNTSKILESCRSLDDLGTDFGEGLYEREVDYLIRNEWAQKADDIVYRRTKLGLRMTPQQISRLELHVAKKLSDDSPSSKNEN